MKCEKLGNHTISYQSLLLSTTVLNDNFGICKLDSVQICHRAHMLQNVALHTVQFNYNFTHA